MLIRAFDATYINSIINHPSVRYGAKVTGEIDLSEFVKDAKNYVLTYEGGGFVLIPRESSYELHTQALKEGRGKKLREAAKEMFEYMFNHCDRVTSMAPHDNPLAIKIANEFMTETHRDDIYIYFEKVKCQ